MRPQTPTFSTTAQISLAFNPVPLTPWISYNDCRRTMPAAESMHLYLYLLWCYPWPLVHSVLFGLWSIILYLALGPLTIAFYLAYIGELLGFWHDLVLLESRSLAAANAMHLALQVAAFQHPVTVMQANATWIPWPKIMHLNQKLRYAEPVLHATNLGSVLRVCMGCLSFRPCGAKPFSKLFHEALCKYRAANPGEERGSAWSRAEPTAPKASSLARAQPKPQGIEP